MKFCVTPSIQVTTKTTYKNQCTALVENDFVTTITMNKKKMSDAKYSSKAKFHKNNSSNHFFCNAFLGFM